MAQHFLLSKDARGLSLKRIFGLSNPEALTLFREARWGKGRDPKCPSVNCGHVANHYFHDGRQRWRCNRCRRWFSVTSGTVFAYRKLPLQIYLAAMAIYTQHVKGIPALALCRKLDVQYKTAFVLAHKLRTALLAQRDDSPLEGDVELDGCYFNGYVKPANQKVNRRDRRLARNQNPKKSVIMVLRQRGGPKQGGQRTLTFSTRSENQSSVLKLVRKYIAAGSTVYADEHSAYDSLHTLFRTLRTNHSVQYSDENGIHTNTAEGFFSRLRRMQRGQCHHFNNNYIDLYANEAAYREDNRRRAMHTLFDDILTKCLETKPSRDLCGYWQHRGQLHRREQFV
ncbi:IS1595 family transposase [Solilutibacter silvestris]|uniref:ISXO2-like transposase protein n=1 Tax=Solilutibacter silvestris TaxID=1645665 RepID=A0A2K1Q227_9GAMM|nr:IS1595 family transposase [Lysobacter silvestris]PNS09108.1 ISXO2-like transposase protein [Lysobacter silvestris]